MLSSKSKLILLLRVLFEAKAGLPVDYRELFVMIIFCILFMAPLYQSAHVAGDVFRQAGFGV